VSWWRVYKVGFIPAADRHGPQRFRPTSVYHTFFQNKMNAVWEALTDFVAAVSVSVGIHSGPLTESTLLPSVPDVTAAAEVVVGATAAVLTDPVLRQTVTDFTVAAGLSGAVYGATFYACVGAGTFAATVVGATAAPIIAPIAGGVIGGMVASYAAPELYALAKGAVQAYAYERPMNETAARWGEILAGTTASVIGGSYGFRHGAQAAIKWLYPTYRDYEEIARGLTEYTFRRHRSLIDPDGLRGPLHHLDHKIPLSWGYERGIPPGAMAYRWNLQMLPAWDNLVKGPTPEWPFGWISAVPGAPIASGVMLTVP
jgi:hypothetical protein